MVWVAGRARSAVVVVVAVGRWRVAATVAAFVVAVAVA